MTINFTRKIIIFYMWNWISYLKVLIFNSYVKFWIFTYQSFTYFFTCQVRGLYRWEFHMCLKWFIFYALCGIGTQEIVARGHQGLYRDRVCINHLKSEISKSQNSTFQVHVCPSVCQLRICVFLDYP